jgi:hypothetical protein
VTQGFDFLREDLERAQKRQQRREQEKSERVFIPYFFLPKNVDEAQVRFVDNMNEMVWAYTHSIPNPNYDPSRKGGRKFVHRTCLDQQLDGEIPCPGCEVGYERAPRGRHVWINLIWRDRAVLKRDPETNRAVQPYEVIGHEDQIMVWEGGKTVLDILISLNKDFGENDRDPNGITSRDFTIRSTGDQRRPYEAARRLPDDLGRDEADKALMAEKFDLKKLALPLSYEDFAAEIPGFKAKSQPTNGDSQSFLGQAPYGNPAEQINTPLATPARRVRRTS